MKRKRLTSGVISSEVVEVRPDECDTSSLADALRAMAAMQSGRQRVQAHLEAAESAASSATTDEQSRLANTAVRLLTEALSLINREEADGVAWNIITALECLWRVDVRQVEPQIITGAKSRNGGAKGNKARAKTAGRSAGLWQRMADEEWRKVPSRSIRDVADRVSALLRKTDPAAPSGDYIRKRISRPVK